MKEAIHNIAIYIDPPHPTFYRDQLFNVNIARLNGDHLLAPYVYLRDFFTSRGIPVHTVDYLPKETACNQNIYISIGNLMNYKRLARCQDIVLSAFFAMECPIVDPSLYRGLNHVQQYFKRIFSWSDSPSLLHFTGGPLRLNSFRWPQSFNDVHEPIWNRRDRKFLVMINANKLPCVYWQELYTERLRAIEFFSRTGEIDLYGVGWDGPPYRMGKSILPATIRRIRRSLVHQWHRLHPDPLLSAAQRVYLGSAVSKSETIGMYTFALCFENMILKGWITEKIFDCFFAGTIPIYWGAPDIEEYVSSECFIDMRHFNSYRELRGYLKSLSEKDILKYKENVREYLKSPQFWPFTKESFVELFACIIEEDTGVHL